MATVGERLRHEREIRGTTIGQIAEATGVGVHYLDALERDDFNALPGRSFGKLYIRAYAEALQLDPKPLVEDYDREQRLVPVDPGKSPWRPESHAAREAAESAAVAAAVTDDAPPAAVAGAARPWRRLAVLGSFGVLAIAALLTAGLRRAEHDPPRIAPAKGPSAIPAAPRPQAIPPPVAEPSPLPPVGEAPGLLSVPESGLGRRVIRSRLEGETDRFAPGEVACFQTRVLRGRGGEIIRHVWIHEGRPQQSIPLRLGGADWRTHSAKTLFKPGSWTVEARDEAGRVLASAAFTCGPADQ